MVSQEKDIETNKKIPKLISRVTGFGVEHWYAGPLGSKPSDETYKRLTQENERFMLANNDISKLIKYRTGRGLFKKWKYQICSTK